MAYSDHYKKTTFLLTLAVSIIFCGTLVKTANAQSITDLVLQSGFDIEEHAVIIGSPTRPVLASGGVVSLDFHAQNGTTVYMTEDPHSERLNFENLDLCAREDMNCSDLGGNVQDNWPRVKALCQNGVWSIEYGGGQCVRPFGCCYRRRDGNIYVDHGCRRINSKELVSYSLTKNLTRICNPDDYLSPKDKKYCLYDYDNKPGTETVNSNGKNIQFIGGVSGGTGDDMFRIKPGAETVLVYRKPEETGDSYPYRAVYIEDNRPANSPHVIMTSGPLGSFDDWEHFIDNPPEGIKIKRVDTNGEVVAGAGCPPITVSLCADIGDSLPEPPVVDGDCGLADNDPSEGGAASGFKGPDGNGYTDVSDIPSDGLCAFGDPQFPAVQNDPNNLVWTCAPPPVLGAGAIDTCKAKRVASYDSPEADEDGDEIGDGDGE